MDDRRYLFDEKYLPDGVRLNVPSELMQRIFSDSRFAVCARNRVNHASNIDTYENLIISLFNEKRYPFSSYPNTFTPKNVTKDMKRALDNLEKRSMERNDIYEAFYYCDKPCKGSENYGI